MNGVHRGSDRLHPCILVLKSGNGPLDSSHNSGQTLPRV
jgi:hypothetical protein